ncbi:protein kinase [bacterium]|nr:protein kinase [bacterium]
MHGRCSNCGSALPTDILEGHCPECLMAVSLGLSLDPASVAAQVEQFPRKFAEFELLEEIARGGMGVVYRARQISLNRIVALKTILSGPFASPVAIDRFRTEARIIASLQHPNIVAIHEVGEAENQPYFTMDFIDGGNLAELVREGPLPPERAARYVALIARAVQHAHEMGVLHRDLKPSNVLLDPFDQPRVTDFGLARQLSVNSQITVTGQLLGSPAYMAPEQIAGRHNDIGPGTDIYSIGAVLYHLLTGRPPFATGTMAQTFQQVLTNEPLEPRALNPAIPIDLQTICAKCLEKDPGKRYADAASMAEDLNRFLRGEPIAARPIGRAEKVRRWCGRNRALALAMIAILHASGFSIAGIVWQWQRAEKSERLTRLNLYAADMMSASEAIARGDLGMARRLLDAHRPASHQEDLRGFEWRYLWQRSRGDQQATLTGHTWIVTCVAYSPDGNLLASGSQDGSIRIWNPHTAKFIRAFHANEGAVWTLQFTPQGDQIVSAGSDGHVRVWDAENWRELGSFEGQMARLSPTGDIVAVSAASPLYWEPAAKISLWDFRTKRKLVEFPEPGKSMAFSADGKILAVTGRERGIRLWDVRSGRLVRTIDTDSEVWSPAFSPNGQRLIAAGHRNAYVWNLEGDIKPVALAHSLNVWSSVFSPDGTEIVTACSDRGVRLWNAASMTLKRVLWGHADEVWCAAFAPDGKTLATGSKDQKVDLWCPRTEAQAEPIVHNAFSRPIYSRSGSALLTVIQTNGQSESILWDLNSRRQIVDFPNKVVVGFAPDGQHVVSLAKDRPAVEHWSLKSKSLDQSVALSVSSDHWPFRVVGFTPDWSLLYGIATDGWVGVFDETNGNLRGAFKWQMPTRPGSGTTKIRSSAISPDGTLLAVAAEEENDIELFQVSTGRETKLKGHRDFVCGLAFSLDGKLLASASVDATIKLWNVVTGGMVANLTGHMEEATDLAFSPDGLTLASVEHQLSVKLWHVPTHRQLMSLDYPEAGFHIAFAPDGRNLAVTTGAAGNEFVRILNADDRR